MHNQCFFKRIQIENFHRKFDYSVVYDFSFKTDKKSDENDKKIEFFSVKLIFQKIVYVQ